MLDAGMSARPPTSQNGGAARREAARSREARRHESFEAADR